MAKNKLGRPTKYDPAMNDLVDAFLEQHTREQTSLPTLEGWADHLGVNADTVHEWKKKYPKFSESIKKILGTQRSQLMIDGMYGGKEVNSTMAIFLLKANHGFMETDKRILAGDSTADPIKIELVDVDDQTTD